jgi:hypothetical protein
MSLTLPILLICILHADILIHEILGVHVCNGVVGSFEVGVGDEAVAFGEAGFIAGDFGGGDEGAKTGEGVVKGLFVDEGVEVSYEELGTYFDCLLLVC